MDGKTTLATVGESNRFITILRESTKRNTQGTRPLSRKAFAANIELAKEFGGNYFDYMKSNESVGAIASEEARAAGLVFAGFNRSTDKVTGELLATSVRWAKPSKSKGAEQDAEIAKLRVELAAAVAKLQKQGK